MGEGKGETKEEGEEEEEEWERVGPSFKAGLLGSKWPLLCPSPRGPTVLPHSPPSAPSFVTSPEETPSCDGTDLDLLPEDGLFSLEQGPSSLILSLPPYKSGWSKGYLPGFVEGLEAMHVPESQRWSLGQQHQHHLRKGFGNANYWPHLRPTISETVGVGPGNLHINKPSRVFTFKFVNHWWTPLQHRVDA